MFDMGLTEMMLIGIVALVVIGPERLPGVARTAGKYVGRLKRFMTSVKADVEQELRADELRQILADQQKELDSLKDTISDAGMDIKQQADVSEALGEASTSATREAELAESVKAHEPEILAETPPTAPETAANEAVPTEAPESPTATAAEAPADKPKS